MTQIDSSFFDRIADPIVAVKALGAAIAQSQMFGCETNAAGEVLAMEVLTRKIPPLELAARYHMIYGKLSMKADYMLAAANARGWRHKIVQRDEAGAAIEMTHPDGRAVAARLTWDAAQKEPFPYEGKERDIVAALQAGKSPPLKSKYATPRSRTQMLWARVVSDLIRSVEPSVNHGEYTPEEISDQVESERGGSPKVEVIMPPVVVPAPEDPRLSAGRADVRRLFSAAGISADKQQDIIRKRGVSTLEELSVDQLVDISNRLISAIEKAKASQPEVAAKPPATAEASPPPGDFRSTPHARCSESHVKQIRSLLNEIESLHPGTLQKFVEKMNGQGMKLADLTVSSAEQLITQLSQKALDEFFRVSLEKYRADNPG